MLNDGWVVCTIGTIAIAIPREHVARIEHDSALTAPLEGERVAGWLTSPAGTWPVCAVDSELNRSLVHARAGSFVVFVTADPPVGLLCDEVRILRATQLQTQPLPAALVEDSNPIFAVARIDATHLACACDGRKLAARLLRATLQGVS